MGLSRGILLPVWEIFRHSGVNDIGHTSAPGAAEIATPGCQVLIPKGTLLPGRELEIDFGYTKSGATETYIPNFRLGPAGTLADPQLSFGPTVAATTRTADAGVRYKIRTNTAIQRIGAAGGSVNEGNSATTVAPANVTISDVTTTDLYLTMTTTMGGATEWITIQRITVTVSG